MCGFIGELRFGQSEFREREWDKALQVIHHRGPDSTGQYRDSDIALGFKRLSIIDLYHGDQPLSYEDGRYQIVFNGEIYNYIELREALIAKGYQFQTDSDTEVIIAMYADMGDACVNELRGMFAFTIWDTVEKVLFGARDPFGIKPFYYYESKERLFFVFRAKKYVCLFCSRRYK